MTWWNDLLETGGEIVGGAIDVAGDLGSEWINAKVDNEADRVSSANPDENRANENNYQQPNGDTVQTGTGAGGFNISKDMAIAAGVAVAICGVLYVVTKKGSK
ncbi:hypothetical protein GT360_07285 [Vibrio astriarenae]|uniref:Uncharacterized protein n=1 Tax=Vibrio astriarenae TaxID=1481923 RepID=A0A7Z2YDF1_9VIBR|nr:hypothetical protein [Vibrio astriarenae]QIA63333.1 hypothetical protein GT360_07285 [Vibrio astriarenae]